MITGNPGTAKTTLAGAFAESASKRGDRTVYVAFDETAQEIVRNLSSVNIHLQEHLDSGILSMFDDYVGARCAEEHFQNIKRLIETRQPTCLVIDPFTAFSNAGSLQSTQAVATRLVRWIKSINITLFCTSLPVESETGLAGTDLKITSVADTWILLNFVDGGERNRGLTIIKSRGTNHSNQVRELILATSGISIAPLYTADGKVLMGTMRWQKERFDAEERKRIKIEYLRHHAVVTEEIAEIETRMQALQRRLTTKQATLDANSIDEENREDDEVARKSAVTELRQADELKSSSGHAAGLTKEPANADNRPSGARI